MGMQAQHPCTEEAPLTPLELEDQIARALVSPEFTALLPGAKKFVDEVQAFFDGVVATMRHRLDEVGLSTDTDLSTLTVPTFVCQDDRAAWWSSVSETTANAPWQREAFTTYRNTCRITATQAELMLHRALGKYRCVWGPETAGSGGAMLLRTARLSHVLTDWSCVWLSLWLWLRGCGCCVRPHRCVSCQTCKHSAWGSCGCGGCPQSG